MKARVLLSLMFTLLAASFATGQLGVEDSGLRPNASYSATDIDAVNLSNGNLFVKIPLWDIPQRGSDLKLQMYLTYNTPRYSYIRECDESGWCPWNYWEWTSGSLSLDFNFDTESYAIQRGIIEDASRNLWQVYYAVDKTGSIHQMGSVGNRYYRSVDTGDVLMQVNAADFNKVDRVLDRSGTYYPDLVYGGSILDRNGNVMAISKAVGDPIYTDTMGRQISSKAMQADLSGCGPSAGDAVRYEVPGPDGVNVEIKLCYGGAGVRTNFSCQYVDYQYDGWNQPPQLVNVVLPTGRSWTFNYDLRFPGDPSSVNYGALTQIITPTGATISYNYEMQCGMEGLLRVTGRTVDSGRIVDEFDGGGPQTWTYDYSRMAYPDWKVTETLPKHSYDSGPNQVVHEFSSTLCQRSAPYEIKTKYYQGLAAAGNLLKTVATDYGCSANPLPGGSAVGVRPIRVTTTLGTVSSKIETDYQTFTYTQSPATGSYVGAYDLVTKRREYDFGQTTPTRTTSTSYYAFDDPNYLTANLLDLPSQVTVQGGGITSTTQYSYDAGGESALQSSGVDQQLHTASPHGRYRGNQTSVTKCYGCATQLTTTNVFYDTGMVSSTRDPGQHTTIFGYSGAYKGAYLTDVWDALNHHRQYTFDFNAGLKLTDTDVDNQTTTSYHYDAMRRLINANFPDGGQVNFSYDDAAPSTQTRTLLDETPGAEKITLEVSDKLGRTVQTQVLSDPRGIVYRDTKLDAFARPSAISNPYRQGDTIYWTKMRYDALGRTTDVVAQDGQTVHSDYSGATTTITDETGRKHKYTEDALGNLKQVVEPTADTWSLSPGILTAYTYNVFGKLASVVQNGSRQRQFEYNALGQLLSASSPESGKTNYVYDADGNLSLRTDARGQTVSYCYDAVHRLKGKRFANTINCDDASKDSWDIAYSYDASTVLPGGYPIGRRAGMRDGSGSTSWQYDQMGRVVKERRTIGTITKDTGYSYKLDGSLWTISYPGGTRTATYATNNAGQVTSVWDSSGTYVADAQYAASGGLETAVLGKRLGTFAGITTFASYDSRLRLAAALATTSAVNIACNSSSGKILHFSYRYEANSNLSNRTDCLNPSASRAMSYDGLNRLLSDSTTAWSQTFGYDSWSNLLSINGPGALSVSVDAANRINSFTYDSAGNITRLGAGSPTLSYDAEGKLSGISGGITYIYDGNAARVAKCVSVQGICTLTKIYWTGLDGEVLAETDGNGKVTNEYIFFNDRRVARNETTGTPPVTSTHYYFSDALGSTSAVTNASGQIERTYDYYAFGGGIAQAGSDSNAYKFTGTERDAEAVSTTFPNGLDYFGARYYASHIGRFLSPDPEQVDGILHPDNPQAWNGYAYAVNNPFRFIDPTGEAHCQLSGDAGKNGANDPKSDPKDVNDPDKCKKAGGKWVPDAGDSPEESSADDGFTLGVRAPGQSFNDCMNANAGNYSLLGVADFALGANGKIADNTLLGFTPASNTITSAYNAATGSLTSLLQTGPTAVQAGMGTGIGAKNAVTYGRRTSSIMSLNLSGTPGGPKGGFPALGSAPSNAARASAKAASYFKLAVDAGFFLAESVGCAIPMKPTKISLGE